MTKQPVVLSRIFRSGFTSSNALFFISTAIVNAGNYLFNLLVGRWLGPASFSDVSVIVTLFLVITFVTQTFQMTAAKFTSINTVETDRQSVAQLRHWMSHRAWRLGVALASFVIIGTPLWVIFFQVQTPMIFLIFGISLPFYFTQGVDRGILQGQMRFGLLAFSYQAEVWTRLTVAISLVAIGLSVNGAIIGLTVSILVTWLVVRRAGKGPPGARESLLSESKEVTRFAVNASALLIGQVLINNSDILIVKHFFDPTTAGNYAALALIGRIVFFATWSVVTVLFPMVAQKHQLGESHRHLLWLSLGLVGIESGGIILCALVAPNLMVILLFGEVYLSIAPFLWSYGIAAAFYALANVVVNYRLSLGHGWGSKLVILAGVMQVVLLGFVHQTLEQVVWIQVFLMAVLLLVLLCWDSWLHHNLRFSL